MALSRPAEAADAFRAGTVLEPESQLWAPLVQKAVKAAETAAVAPKKAATVAPSGASGSSRTVISGGTSTAPATTRRSPPATNSKGSAPGVQVDSAASGTGSGMKGYKKTADGRTTTYFNNDLTDEAKALIGDIAPKKLQATTEGGIDAGNGAAGNEVSAWNKAGTWESRDMTRLV